MFTGQMNQPPPSQQFGSQSSLNMPMRTYSPTTNHQMVTPPATDHVDDSPNVSPHNSIDGRVSRPLSALDGLENRAPRPIGGERGYRKPPSFMPSSSEPLDKWQINSRPPSGKFPVSLNHVSVEGVASIICTALFMFLFPQNSFSKFYFKDQTIGMYTLALLKGL